MSPSTTKSEFRIKIISLSLCILANIVLAIIISLLLVAYEGIIWGGEGLFSFMLVSPIFSPILALLGVGIIFSAYKTEDRTKRAKVIKFGSIIYIRFVFTVFIVMSGTFHDTLGPYND